MKADGVTIAHFTVGAGSILGLPAVVAKEPYSLECHGMSVVGSRVAWGGFADESGIRV